MSRRQQKITRGRPLSRRMVRRFVAGETLDEAISVVADLTGDGCDDLIVQDSAALRVLHNTGTLSGPSGTASVFSRLSSRAA